MNYRLNPPWDTTYCFRLNKNNMNDNRYYKESVKELLVSKDFSSISIGNESFESMTFDCKRFEKINFMYKLAMMVNVVNFEEIYRLKNLVSLHLKVDVDEVDFSLFPNLSHIGLQKYYQNTNLDRCENLSSLRLFDYVPKMKEYLYDKMHLNELYIYPASIKDVDELENIFIKVLTLIDNRRILSLKNIENHNELEVLEISYFRLLEDVSDLSKCKNLKALYIYNCKKISNLLETLENLPHLEDLVLENVGNIDNVQFINKMPNLKTFSFGAAGNNKILDKDLTPFLKLKSVNMWVKKGYNLTREEIPSDSKTYGDTWYRDKILLENGMIRPIADL